MSAYQQGRPKTETVLILQGGGSLGAYECGVISTLYKHGINFNIIAGSSIGAINASIIASAQNRGKDPANSLKDFWQVLADNGAPFFLTLYCFPTLSVAADKMMAILSSIFSVAYGNPKAFMPR
jgi:NTE family protein